MKIFLVKSVICAMFVSLSLFGGAHMLGAQPQDVDALERAPDRPDLKIPEDGDPDFNQRDELEDPLDDELAEREDVLPKRKLPPLVMPREGKMTPKRLARIAGALGEVVQKRGNVIVLEIDNRLITMAVDVRTNRMRLMSPIVKTDQLSKEHLMRLMQANFDTSLDARYAIAKGILWSTYIHPLSSLHKNQFISAIAQTINAARTFGTTFSSGILTFGSGDSQGILERELIDQLLKKGKEI